MDGAEGSELLTHYFCDAPFPDDRCKVGARQFPVLVPDRPDDPDSEPNHKARAVIQNLPTPVLTVFGVEERIMAGADHSFETLPVAAWQAHVLPPNAGYSLRQDLPAALVETIPGYVRPRS